jgi:hypothetical protein
MAEPVGQQEKATMSEPRRFIGMYFEPKAVFEDLLRKSSWWFPVVISSILAVAYLWDFSRVVGWANFMRQQLEQSPRTQNLSPEQMEQILQQQTQFGLIFGYIGAAVGMLITVVIISAVLLGIFKVVASAELKFNQTMSIVAYSFAPGVLGTLLAILVMHLKDPEDFDLQNPLSFHAAAFLTKSETAAWLWALLSSIDLFVLWYIVLMAVGFSVFIRKMTFGRALTLIVIPWGLFVLIKMGWASIFGA